jgi:hypothetical protein
MTGLWTWPCVPHRAWQCVGYHDMKEQTHLCEMCRSHYCRYVFTMRHPNFPNLLEVGNGCMEAMSKPYADSSL